MRSADSLNSPAEGARAAAPIVFGYLPIGFAAGVVGVGAGLSPAEVALLSLLVFAGSAQFVFADLVNGSPTALVTTVFLINFRYFLYSAALSRKIRRLPASHRAAVGAQLTDETFALASALYRRAPNSAGGLLALNFVSYSAWFFGSVGGAVFGAQAGLADWGADFLLVAMFAALLFLNVGGDARKIAVAVVAAALMVAFELFAAHPLNILLAAGSAAAVGAWLGGGSESAPEEDEG